MRIVDYWHGRRAFHPYPQPEEEQNAGIRSISAWVLTAGCDWLSRIKSAVLLAAALMFALSGAFGAINVVRIIRERQTAGNLYSHLRDACTQITGESPLDNDIAQSLSVGTESATFSGIDFDIDFDGLRDINPEFAAWLYIPGTNINYPIARGTDNEKYLHTAFDLKENSCGAIFMDYRNSGYFSDRHTVIYGHNIRGGLMFGPLREYNDGNFFERHREFYIITPPSDSPEINSVSTDSGRRGTIYKYSIFSHYVTGDWNETYRLNFTDAGEYNGFAASLAGKSSYGAQGVPAANDGVSAPDIVTLSTCVSDSAKRRVIHGALTEKSR
jgi:sortase B